ncbi:MAG: YihY/virulence factor BrkB family protein [Deltaproteobacteria bacterium]|nr:YihY/virulence factor BrkB family protein [Deltaproteobacteria bacterium]
MPKTPAPEPSSERSRTVKKSSTGPMPVRFIKQLGKECFNDNIDDVGAMMAYYAVLALFPMLVLIVTVGLLVLDPTTVHEGVRIATQAMPQGMRNLIFEQVSKLIEASSAGFAILGAVLALWGASRGAAALTGALNTIFNKKETRPFWKRQLTAIAVTLGVSVLVLLALGMLTLGPLVGHYFADRFGLGATFDVVWGIGRWIGAGLLVMFVWAVLYRFLPDTDAPFRVLTPGAVVGVLLWIGISLLFGLYLSYFNRYDATYGALGSAIVFLIWLWLSNLALLVGAEFNDVLAAFRKNTSADAAQLAHKEVPDAPEKA